MDLVPSSDLLIRDFGVRPFARCASAWVRDGIHHMVVSLKHDGRKIVAVSGRALSSPWTTCPEAVVKLDTLVGLDFQQAMRLLSVDQQLHCTHLLDLARLALRQIATPERRRYRVSVQRLSNVVDNIIDARVERNGRTILQWSVRNYVVATPLAFAGHRVDGRAILSREVLDDDDLFEATMMLRRGVKMLRGRDRSSQISRDIPPADRLWMMGVCYSFQPGIVARARRFGPIT